MNPQWSLQNRGWLIARLVFRGHTALMAEEAVDQALAEIEDRVQTRGWQFSSDRHFCNVWLKRAGRRAVDLLRRSQRRPRPRPRAPTQEWRTVFTSCLAQLEEVQGRILQMYYWEGLGDVEIGRLLWPEEPASTTSSRANRMRHLAVGAMRAQLLQADLDAQTLDFEYGRLGRLRRHAPEL